ncbi:MAG: sigma-70 family RNA polymerase sigma factor [Anaerolineae bacterium]|nr:sigma-70 family RNA polymerase sigma factor [Anaerolineae bacterium]
MHNVSGDESRWIAQAITGDVEAFGELVRAFERPVFNLAYRMLGDAAEAEDAAQEAFIKAYTNLHRYDPERSFKTWLLSITSNHCIDILRKRRLTWLSLDNEQLPPHPALTSDQPGPEAAAITQERSMYIQDMLNGLSQEYRLVVILRYWYDLSYAEIAEMLETTESAIKSRLFRARQALAQQIDAQEAPHLVAALEGLTP